MSTSQPGPFNQDFNTSEIPRVPENLAPPQQDVFNAAALAPMQPPNYAPPPPQQRSTAVIVATVLAVLLFILVSGIVVYAVAGNSIKNALGGNAADQPAQVTQTVVVSPEEKATGSKGGSNSRPTRENFPTYVVPVNAAAISNAPAGKFQKIFKSGPTSDSFALQVGADFLSNYYATGSTSTSMSVYSSVTGYSYYMTCIDRGSYVHCTGGNNANVYIS